MSTATLRQQAANLIREHGWVQDWEGDCDHGFCISEALTVTACQLSTDEPVHQKAIWEIARHIVEQGEMPTQPVSHFRATGIVVGFNDTPGRTIDEILEVLEP